MNKLTSLLLAVFLFSATLIQGQNVNGAILPTNTPALPDLVIQDVPTIERFNYCYQTPEFTVSAEVRNIGSASTKNQTFDVVFSASSTSDFGGCQTTVSVNLEPGDSTKVTCKISKNPSKRDRSGTITLYATADLFNEILETNEVNGEIDWNNRSPAATKYLYPVPKVENLVRSAASQQTITWTWNQNRNDYNADKDSYNIYLDGKLVRSGYKSSTNTASYTAFNLACRTNHTIKVVPSNKCSVGPAAESRASTYNCISPKSQI